MRSLLYSLAASCTICALVGGAMTAAVAQDRRPNVRLAPQLVTAATAFEAYARTTSEISPAFTDAASVAEALRVGAAYEPKQLSTGVVAYAALAALQEPAFVEGVRAAARADGVAAVARRMRERPDLALYLPGGRAAAERAGAALAAQADPLREDGARVKQAAYDVQREAWSKVFVPNAQGRLTRIKQISSVALEHGQDDGAELVRAVTTEASPRSVVPGPVVYRALAVAVLAVLDRAGEEDAGDVLAVADEPMSASCLRLAKLNLFQCLAVAGPHYEDVFCLGEHAMLEPAKCVSKASGAQGGPLSAPALATTIATVAPIERR